MESTRQTVRIVRASRFGFTLVELLVVITIIGILVALITAAASGALKTAAKTRIKTDIDQIAMAMETYKNDKGSYPPNCQVDGTAANQPIAETQVLADLKRHLKQAFPGHRESDELIARLAGLQINGTSMLSGTQGLQGGMTASEAVVFWLGGFSSDPKYPISGEGGPSYLVDGVPLGTRREVDPLDRKWIYPFKVERLEPRKPDKFFDDSNNRYIEYSVKVNGVVQNRRINFWQYRPDKSEVSYIYFDVSRHPAVDIPSAGQALATYDPPAATDLAVGLALPVYAIKKLSEQAANATTPVAEFANKDKFQLLHPGIDEAWGDFSKMTTVSGTQPSLLYPAGPFTGDVADTIVNFSDATLEASQK